MKYCFTITFVFSILFGLAQEYKTIRAQLRSSADSSSIAYAHIGIPSWGMGTISNYNGFFEFHFPADMQDSIEISHLSHYAKMFSAEELLNGNPVIYLDLIENELDEVLVYPRDSIRTWLGVAFRRIKANGPKGRNLSIGFFREIQFEDKSRKNTRLVEAAIAVQDKKMNASLNSIRIKPVAFRKSDNDVEYNSYHKRMVANFGERNVLDEMFKRNPIRVYRKPSKNGKDIFNRMLRDTSAQFEVVEHIKRGSMNRLRIAYDCEGSFIGRVKGEIMLNRVDFGLLSFTASAYFIFPKDGSVNDLSFAYRIDQKKIGGVYMPIFIRMRSVSDVRQVKGKGQLGMGISTIIFTEHYTNKEQFKKIRRWKAMKDDINIYDFKAEYDPEFWENYNVLLDEPLDQHVVSDLEAKRSLKQQFRENGKKVK